MGRSGGVATGETHDQNVYFIPEVAEIMFDYLKPHYADYKCPLILDACCGSGVLGKSLSKILNGKCKTTYHDINMNGQSILEYKTHWKFDIIVCNPPWAPVSTAEKIYHFLISMLSDAGVLFFIINNTFMYQGWERAVELQCSRYYFLPRYVFKWSGRPLLDCGAMVYHKSQVPDNAIPLSCYIHIPPDIEFEYREDMIEDRNNLFYKYIENNQEKA